MEITSLGHSSFKIRSKYVTIVTDPYDPSFVGMPYPKHVTADIITISHDHNDHNASDQIEGDPFVIHGPGEYEVKGASIIGTPSYHDEKKGEVRGTNTMYHIFLEGVNIVHLGDLGHMLTAADVEKLDGVDILFIPVGGTVTLSAKDAAALVSELEPTIVIPMHYKTPKHTEKSFGELESVDSFLKAMGKTDVTPVGKLSVTKDKLPQEMQVIVLE